MENILDKLNQIHDDTRHKWSKWSLAEIKTLLEIYYTITKKESHILELVYRYHGTDTFEDIFRDYDEIYLRDKAIGVEIAINEIANMGENKDYIEDDKEYSRDSESTRESKNEESNTDTNSDT